MFYKLNPGDFQEGHTVILLSKANYFQIVNRLFLPTPDKTSSYKTPNQISWVIFKTLGALAISMAVSIKKNCSIGFENWYKEGIWANPANIEYCKLHLIKWLSGWSERLWLQRWFFYHWLCAQKISGNFCSTVSVTPYQIRTGNFAIIPKFKWSGNKLVRNFVGNTI